MRRRICWNKENSHGLKLDLDKELPRKTEFEEEFKILHEEHTTIYLSLAAKITSSTESIAEAVKLLFSDVNELLEHGQQNSNLIVEHETKNMKFNTEPGHDNAPQRLLLPPQRASVTHRDTSRKVKQSVSRASRSHRSNQW